MKSPKKYAELLPGDILVYTRPGLTGPSFISSMYLIVGMIHNQGMNAADAGSLLYMLTVSEQGFVTGRIQEAWWPDTSLLPTTRCIVIRGQ